MKESTDDNYCLTDVTKCGTLSVVGSRNMFGFTPNYPVNRGNRWQLLTKSFEMLSTQIFHSIVKDTAPITSQKLVQNPF